MTRQHDIFLSYSRKDSATMRRVRDSMIAAGLTVWTDEGIEPGTESWKQSIQQAIEHCGAMVVLLSPDAKRSVWVKREIAYARTHTKRVFTLLARGTRQTSIPFELVDTQFVDIRTHYKYCESQLVPVILEHLGIQNRAELEQMLQNAKDKIEKLSQENAELREVLQHYRSDYHELEERQAKLSSRFDMALVRIRELEAENKKLYEEKEAEKNWRAIARKANMEIAWSKMDTSQFYSDFYFIEEDFVSGNFYYLRDDEAEIAILHEKLKKVGWHNLMSYYIDF